MNKYFLLLKPFGKIETGLLYPITFIVDDGSTVQINQTNTFDSFTWGATKIPQSLGEIVTEETVHTMELEKYIVGNQPDPTADVDLSDEPDIDEEFDVDEGTPEEIKAEPIGYNQQFHPIPTPDGFKGKTETIKIKRSDYDDVNRPEHYHAGGIDVIGFAEKKLSTERMKAFYQVNVMKYVTRYERKNKIEDLEKAKFYIDKLIETEQKG